MDISSPARYIKTIYRSTEIYQGVNGLISPVVSYVGGNAEKVSYHVKHNYNISPISYDISEIPLDEELLVQFESYLVPATTANDYCDDQVTTPFRYYERSKISAIEIPAKGNLIFNTPLHDHDPVLYTEELMSFRNSMKTIPLDIEKQCLSVQTSGLLQPLANETVHTRGNLTTYRTTPRNLRKNIECEFESVYAQEYHIYEGEYINDSDPLIKIIPEKFAVRKIIEDTVTFNGAKLNIPHSAHIGTWCFRIKLYSPL